MNAPGAVTPRRATPADVPAAARVLADAFDGYAWTDWVLPPDGRHARLVEVQGLYLAHAVAHGIVLVADDPDATGTGAGAAGLLGAVALVPVDVPPPDEAVWRRVAELHGDRVERLADVEPTEPPDGAWTLATLGVAPAARGAGLGSRLVAAAHDALGDVPVVLDTSDPRNVTLYERHGYRVVRRTDVPGGPSVWSMLRAPGGPAAS